MIILLSPSVLTCQRARLPIPSCLFFTLGHLLPKVTSTAHLGLHVESRLLPYACGSQFWTNSLPATRKSAKVRCEIPTAADLHNLPDNAFTANIPRPPSNKLGWNLGVLLNPIKTTLPATNQSSTLWPAHHGLGVPPRALNSTRQAESQLPSSTTLVCLIHFGPLLHTLQPRLASAAFSLLSHLRLCLSRISFSCIKTRPSASPQLAQGHIARAGILPIQALSSPAGPTASFTDQPQIEEEEQRQKRVEHLVWLQDLFSFWTQIG